MYRYPEIGKRFLRSNGLLRRWNIVSIDNHGSQVPPKQPTLVDLARMVHALTKQLAATEERVKKLERLISSSARAKTERLSKDEWLARRRKVIEETNAKRWAHRPKRKTKRLKRKARVEAP